MTSEKPNVWIKLWEVATGEAGAPAVIEPDPEDEGRVTLRWPDGSVGHLVWHDGRWTHAGTLDLAPCDVAARDSF